MRIEVDGQSYEVPDDASVDEIDAITKPKALPGRLEAVGRGFAQGGTMGLGDEGAGLGAATQAAVAAQPELAGVPDAELYALARSTTRGEDYSRMRNQSRASNKAVQEAHPGYYAAGEVTGAMAPAAASALLGGAAAPTGASVLRRLMSPGALAASAGQGAVQGAGYSDASTPGALAADSSLGAGVGTLAHGLGAVVGAAGSSVASRLRGVADAARGRAGTQAETEVADKLRTAIGRYGGEVQKGSRFSENIGRLGTELTPEEQALKSALEEQVGASTRAALPGQSATIATRKAEMEALQAGAPDAISSRLAELVKPSVGADIKSLGKSYAEPLLAMLLADKAADAMGLDDKSRMALDAGAGVVFGRTRAGKAIANRLRKPGNQIALTEGLASMAPTQDGLLARLLRGATAPSTEPALNLRR